MKENSSSRFKDISFINNIKSMAVVGISARRDYFFLRNHQANFKGNLYAVHPKIEQIPNFDDGTQGKIFKSVKQIPGKVDFVFIAVPPSQIINVVDDCVQKGVKLASIFTAEFSDAGTQEGIELERKLLEHAQNKLRILGPNGMGLFYPKLGIAWRPFFPNTPGNVGFIAQSGGICNIAIYSSKRLGINFSKVFSYGNGADLDFVDILNFLLDDPETDIILGYIEGLNSKRGRDLQFLLEKDYKKPIIIVKGGKSEKGDIAVQTHTASISGNQKIWKSVFHQYNLIEVDTLEQLLSTARILDFYNVSQLRNFSILSISGGYGVILVDLLENFGFNVPSFSDNIQKKLSEKFFTLGTSPKNPLDVSAQIYHSQSIYDIINLALKDKNIDGLIMDLPSWYFNVDYHINKDFEFEDQMIKAMSLGHKHNKPIFPIIQTADNSDHKERIFQKLKKNKVPVFNDPLEFIPLLQKIANFYTNAKKQNYNN
jgi:acyl-CoA synthetase (NDP forming)